MNEKGSMEEMKKMPLTQIVESTGMTEDYLPEFTDILSLINIHKKKGAFEPKEFLKIVAKQCSDRRRPRTYQERYPDKDYRNVINEKNRENVAALNEAVLAFRKSYDASENFPFAVFLDSYNKAMFAIYGNQDKFLDPNDYSELLN